MYKKTLQAFGRRKDSLSVTTLSVRLSFLFILIVSSQFTSAKDSQINPSEIKFSDSSSSISEEQYLKMYGLTASQWKQYQVVMKGPRGMWSPNIHPVMALGMRKGISNGELKRLAKQMATINFERVKRELAFEHAVRREGMKKYGHIPLYTNDQILESTSSDSMESFDKSEGRIQFFVKPPCARCAKPISEWISKGEGFDLFILGSKKEVTLFAKKMGISPLLVPSQITLNTVTESEIASLGIRKLPAMKRANQ